MSIADLRAFASDLRRLPTVVGQEVARAAAPEITKLAKRSFDETQTPYGVPWAPSPTGDRVTLRATGSLERRLYYVAVGTRLRVALGVPYAKFQIGKRPVFPRQDSRLPPDYVATLQRIAVDVCRRELGGGR